MRLLEALDDPPHESNASGWFDPITDIVVSEDPPVRTDPPGPPRQLLHGESSFPGRYLQETHKSNFKYFYRTNIGCMETKRGNAMVVTIHCHFGI